jgi:pyridinium-3,5-bisthiocarboxylic acid mononucleotide nickel chelatase
VHAVGGVAGDMLLAALIDLGADATAIRRAFASLQVRGLALDVSRVEVSGERALYVRSLAPHEGHSHRHLSEIEAVIGKGDLSDVARARALRIFRVLTEAEARVHGGSVDEVALHEVGELDSILDVVGISVALESLGNPALSVSSLPSGQGVVRTAHGELSVPVPAVLELAQRFNIPLEPAPLRGETVTPTGIAVLAVVAERFGLDVQPPYLGTGIGAGTRRFADRPNVVRIHALEA